MSRQEHAVSSTTPRHRDQPGVWRSGRTARSLPRRTYPSFPFLPSAIRFFLIVLLQLGPAVLSPAQSQVALSELMYDPAGDENKNEFVEVYNADSSQAVDLAGWLIGDDDALDAIIDAGGGTVLAPRSYAIILDADYWEGERPYDDIIPDKALVLTIDGSTFGSRGFSNSQSERVTLQTADSSEVAAFQYPLLAPPSFSLEKRDLAAGDAIENWGVSLNLNGTPGAKNSVATRERDLSVSAEQVVVNPAAPGPGDVIRVKVPVHNSGRAVVDDFTAALFNDTDGDSLAAGQEVLDNLSVEGANLQPGDSTWIEFNIGPLSPGMHRIGVEVVASDDELTGNNKAFIDLIVSTPRGAALVNEVMYRPSPSMAEWVEIYNSSDLVLELRGWRLRDATVTSVVELIRESYSLRPSAYLVVAEDSTFLDEHPDLRPGQVLVPPDGLPALNNTGDAVRLIAPGSGTVDSLQYRSSWGGENGVSLERIRWDRPTNDPVNWGTSVAECGGTPGERNSITPAERDLALTGIGLPRDRIVRGAPFELNVSVANAGLLPASDYSVRVFLDENGDRTGQDDELVAPPGYAEAPLASGDTARISIEASIRAGGRLELLALLNSPNDARAANDSASQVIDVGFPAGSISVNEIMFRPREDHPEWIEIFNGKPDEVNIQGWTIADATNTHGNRVTDAPLLLASGGYAIIASDSSLARPPRDSGALFMVPDAGMPSLNNSGDQVVLRDITGATMDSLAYDGAWAPEPGQSIERLHWDRPGTDPENWAASQDSLGSTPGFLNSISPREVDIAVDAGFFQTNPRPLRRGEEATLAFRLVNAGLSDLAGIAVQLYDDADYDGVTGAVELHGEASVPGTLAPGVSQSVAFAWTPVHSGIHRLFLHVGIAGDMVPSNDLGEFEVSVAPLEADVVINEIMFAPPVGQVEWVEVVNRSNVPANLHDWLFADRDSAAARRLIPAPALLLPNGFAVISPDTLPAFMRDGSPDALWLVVAGFPSLSNIQDTLYLFDVMRNVVDRVVYDSRWSVDTRASLERLNPDLPSLDPENWQTSVAGDGSTPGRRNSIFTSRVPSSASLSVSPSPFSPDGDGRDDYTLISYRLPGAVNLLRIKVFDARGRLVRSIADNRRVSAQGDIPWDGTDDERRRLPVGIYIVHAEAVDTSTGNRHTAQQVVVLAARL